MAHLYTAHKSPHVTIKYVSQFVPISERVFVAIQSSSGDEKDLGDVVEPVDEHSVPLPSALLTILQIPQLGKMKPLARPLMKVAPPMYLLILQTWRRSQCPRTATIPLLSSSSRHAILVFEFYIVGRDHTWRFERDLTRSTSWVISETLGSMGTYFAEDGPCLEKFHECATIVPIARSCLTA